MARPRRGDEQQRYGEDHQLVAARVLPDVLVERLMMGHAVVQLLSANL